MDIQTSEQIGTGTNSSPSYDFTAELSLLKFINVKSPKENLNYRRIYKLYECNCVLKYCTLI